ncbi:MAG TPA: AI-2E family transporter [Anaerolineales bacterium]|nr:AI-2E family transporter [Anaerolineales bacterium]
MKSEWSLSARYFTLALIIAFLVFVGYEIREIFRPLIFAGVIAYLFYPLVALIQRRFGLNRRTASNIVYFVSLAAIIIVPVILVPILLRQTSEIAQDLQQTLADAQAYLANPISIGGIPIDLGGMIAQYRSSLFNPLSSISQNAVTLIRDTSRSTLWVLIIFGGTYFFMTEWENVREGLVRVAPEAYRPDIRRIYSRIRQVWMAYLRGQLTLMIIVAITFIILWTIIGLPGSLYLGLLAGLFSIVPDVGPVVATGLALAVALLEGSMWLPVNNFVFGLIVVGLYVVLINIEHIWLRPYILGRSVHMNEALVFIVIIAALIFSGILGAFIIVPVLASLVVIWNYLHARMLGLPPFLDEVPAAPIPEAPERDSPPAGLARPRTPAKKRSSK